MRVKTPRSAAAALGAPLLAAAILLASASAGLAQGTARPLPEAGRGHASAQRGPGRPAGAG